ncbi:MAG: hypothetical protein AAGD32_12145 [Planctomycetota bacterium]
MDAETRAQLERNSLAMALAETPAFLARHGTKILIGLCVLLLIITLVQRRNRAASSQAQNQVIYLSNAREMVQRLTRLPDIVVDDNDRTNRVAMATDAVTALDALRDDGDDAAKIEALLIRGDLYRQLSRQPKLGDAFNEPAVYGELAIQSYLAVLADAGSETGPQAQQRISARMGLAAAYEDAGMLDKADEQYAAIQEESAATGYQRLIAEQRVEMNAELTGGRPMPAPNFLSPTTQPAEVDEPMLGEFGMPDE